MNPRVGFQRVREIRTVGRVRQLVIAEMLLVREIDERRELLEGFKPLRHSCAIQLFGVEAVSGTHLGQKLVKCGELLIPDGGCAGKLRSGERIVRGIVTSWMGRHSGTCLSA